MPMSGVRHARSAHAIKHRGPFSAGRARRRPLAKPRVRARPWPDRRAATARHGRQRGRRRCARQRLPGELQRGADEQAHPLVVRFSPTPPPQPSAAAPPAARARVAQGLATSARHASACAARPIVTARAPHASERGASAPALRRVRFESSALVPRSQHPPVLPHAAPLQCPRRPLRFAPAAAADRPDERARIERYGGPLQPNETGSDGL